MSNDMTSSLEVDGTKVRNARMLRGESLVSFAPKIGISFQFLSQIERGDRRVSPQTFARICDELGIDMDDRRELVKAAS
jgi:transcriptional regulator with XRE-family HTH domain